MKTPFEFVASAARASGADIQNALPLVATLNRMGMPLYAMQPPTGYSMKAEAWVNSSALLNRMNFALQLASGKLPGTSLDPQALIQGPGAGGLGGCIGCAGAINPGRRRFSADPRRDAEAVERSADLPAQAGRYGQETKLWRDCRIDYGITGISTAMKFLPRRHGGIGEAPAVDFQFWQFRRFWQFSWCRVSFKEQYKCPSLAEFF